MTERAPTSAVLGDLRGHDAPERVALGWLMGRLGDRSFGVVLLLLALPGLLPGVSALAGVLLAVNGKTVGTVLAPLLNRDTLLYTDGLAVYRAAAKERGFAHQLLNLKAGARVKERVFHIQHVNAYRGRLKDWMRRFRGAATRYLLNYLGWRRLLERNRDAPPAFPVVLASALG